ncbi:ankyrin repeat domain-containing protein [Wolbachia endosymbiont (group B) of Sphaerophoria taeniata]|uniref:ankyrin repeat domain-containing protein n=1 Tax=Wolbachia endosymbiont (group B) of Sphaerophoria taeniata TaxID=2954058 RepID=UPI00221E9B25|nr:ankyrin repeat domain-containing protein [Wolbachia endosymbiont (group B) of Sphaerophoria taeniata]
MTGEYESLEKVLRTIEAEKDLNLNNIIEKIQEELKEQDQGLYKDWEEGKFDVNHGFSLNISGIEYSKLPLLIIAARNGYIKTVGVLLGVGANVNAVDQCKRTPLHHAALNDRVGTVEVLLKEGAKVDSVDQYEMTALHNAAENGHKKIVGILIENKADNIDAKNCNGSTALYCAALNNHANIVNALIKAGADVNEKDISGWTALHCAASNGHVDTVEALIKEGANVNAVDKNGMTYLDYAEKHTKKCAEEKYAEGYAKGKNVIKALLEEGGGSFVKARNKSMIAGGVTGLLGTAIAVALFTTGTIAAQLIPIVIAVVAVIAAALVVGCATYELLKPSTKVDGAEKSSAALINGQQGVTSIPS